MARQGRWTRPVDAYVWVSGDGSPLGQEGMSGRIELRTREAFGKAINPHAFRDGERTEDVLQAFAFGSILDLARDAAGSAERHQHQIF